MAARNVHAGLPITDDDEAIAAALEDVSIPTLILSLVHITGDPSWIQSELKPQGLFLNEVQGFMSDEAKAQVRKLALEVIRNRSSTRGTRTPRGRSTSSRRGDSSTTGPGRRGRTCATSCSRASSS